MSGSLASGPWWLRICLQFKRAEFNPWVGKIPWRRKWQPTLVFWPGKSDGQRSLAGYSPGGCKGSDVTKVTEHTGNAQKVSGCVAGHSLVGSQMRLVGLWTVGRNRGGATPPVTMAAFSSMFAQG